MAKRARLYRRSERRRSRPLSVETLECRSLLTATVGTAAQVPPLVTIATIVDTSEGNAPGMVRISRAGDTSLSLTVALNRGGNASYGEKADYTLAAGGSAVTGKTIVIPAGSSAVDVVLTAVDDLVAEPTETVVFTLRANPSYSLDPVSANRSAFVSIVDNEPVVSIVASDPIASEIDGATSGKGVFTITRSTSENAVAIKFTRSGSAKPGADYVLRRAGSSNDLQGSEITLAAGESSASIEVVPLNDAVREAAESVVLKLKSAKQYFLNTANQQATVTIANNAPPTLTAIGTLSATRQIPVVITYESLLAASDASDPEGSSVLFLLTSVASGSLQKGGQPVKANSTTLGPGETLSWSPKLDAEGKTAAFAVKATDGMATSSSAVPVSVNLPSRITLTDASKMLVAGEGLNALQYSPNGTLARLLWTDTNSLVYSERRADGTWDGAIVANDLLAGEDSWYATDKRDFESAQLLFSSSGVPHVVLTDSKYVWHFHRQGSVWQSERILPDVAEVWGGDSGFFTAAIGADDSIHVAMSNVDSPNLGIYYGTNASGTWAFERAFDIAADRWGHWMSTGAYSRYFGLSVDAQNKAHIVYTPDFRYVSIPGGVRCYSELAYGTNRTGVWTTQTVFSPPDGTGDAGEGASIAIDPSTNRPAIASFYIDRYDTGSPYSSKLLYHTLQADGRWTNVTVASSADGYTAGDGNKGTGFAPKLVFDAANRPNILFCDLASQHFADVGADEFAGQLRHARLIGNQWKIQTVYRQSDPVHNYLIYPTMALNGNEASYMAIWKHDPRNENSDATYQLVELTLPLSA